ncbi:MAG TPA: type II toxin-antitoxin system RatA family toxin [Xanthomonadaceae bacterium]|nr:type II toxin-antitoxin system RatA family toxin [Xanthomonadaceae bacterium]
MTAIHRSALVARPAGRLYALVNDVESYPRRFAWCDAARVLEQAPDLQVARLTVRAGAVTTTFTTRNRLEPGRRIGLELVDGPFKRLQGQWSFIALSAGACKVTLDLEFEMAGMLDPVLAVGFRGLADRMVDDFCRAARGDDD